MATEETAVVPVPDPASPPRQYVRIRPTADPLEPETVHQQVRRLHHLTRTATDRRWHHRLTGGPTPPVIECLLVSDGRDDTDIEYYLGLDSEAAFDPFARTLRLLFPDTYEFERTVWHPDHLVPDADERPVAAVEFHAETARRKDWQTTLTPFLDAEATDRRVPLAAVVETMTATPVPMVYQVLLRPRPDWSTQAELRRRDLEANRDSLLGLLWHNHVRSPDAPAPETHPENRQRLAELEMKNPRECFDVNARAIAIAPTTDQTSVATAAVAELASALSPVGNTSHRIAGEVTHPKHARAVLDRLCDRTVRTGTAYSSVLAFWGPTKRPTIVADPREAPNFFLLDGTALSAAGSRSVAPTPGERTTLTRPPRDQLQHYRQPGLTLGRPRTEDGHDDPEPIAVPPALQPLHAAWFGKTGSGKSTSLTTAILDNHAATDGASILIDPKGDGMAADYCRAHHARFGTLDDVRYFDCANTLPAFGFFDIRDELDAGVPRATAVEDKVDHTIELLVQVMGRERFDRAVRAPDVIRYLVKAAFDPVNGADAFSQRDLHASVRQMHERQAAPPVADSDLEQALGGIVANRTRTFDEIMAAVANRLEKLTVDRRLARIFNHVPRDGEPHFDLAALLDRNVVVIIETGELRTEARRVLALVILSNLWTALRRRLQRGSNAGHPLVNLYLEEAASIATSDLLKTLLAQARGFDCAVTLSMQFPAQLEARDPDAYAEVLNNVSTVVAGNVPVDRRLADRFATDDMDSLAVANRIRGLSRGEWLVKLPAAFGDAEPRPFTVASMPLPTGHPDIGLPTPTERWAYDEAFATLTARTLDRHGLTLAEPIPAPDDTDDEPATAERRLDSALPYTRRLPPTVRYVPASHALECRACTNRYDPTIDGMKRAIACCSSLDDVDRDDVPVCELNLKRTPDELDAAEWTASQLLFLQAVHNAMQGRFDPLEYDLRRDSMLRLQEYVGLEADAVEDLIDAGLLRHDTDHPHRLYSVTPAGRNAIGESYREGIDFGHGQGDLEESSPHILGVQLATQFLEDAYVRDPDSPVVAVHAYHDVGGNHRLDAVGLDAHEDIVVTVEVERVNHDVRRAVPEDFDKMAAAEATDAVWVVMSHTEAHEVLAALNDPLDGEPRVTKTYSRSTPVQDFLIDEPGLTAVYTVDQLRDRLGLG